MQRDEVTGKACCERRRLHGQDADRKCDVGAKTSLPANAVTTSAVRFTGFARYTRSVNTQVALTTSSGPSMPSHTSLPNQTASKAADSTLPVVSHNTVFKPGPASYPLPCPQTVLASS